jgi:hypothetical protein
VSSPAETEPAVSDHAPVQLIATAVAALVVSAVLGWAARTGAVELLVAIAVAQALLGVVWMVTLRVPGRIGGLLIATGAAVITDVAASVWPHSRLAATTAVLGLAVPAMFVHQLVRGAGRVRVAASLGGIALLVVAETGLPALLQLRHEFAAVSVKGDAALTVIVVIGGALVAGCFADMVYAAPRFDDAVPRGLLGVVVATLVAAALGHLLLRTGASFGSGRAAFVGAAVGVCTALLAVGTSYVDAAVPPNGSAAARRTRALLPVLLPFAVVAPVALLLCLAIRS